MTARGIKHPHVAPFGSLVVKSRPSDALCRCEPTNGAVIGFVGCS
jgi:hypothetical protein